MTNPTITQLKNKWEGVLDYKAFNAIQDDYKRGMTAVMLEAAENESRKVFQSEGLRASVSIDLAGALNEDPASPNLMGASSSTAGAGGIDIFDPVMISLVRRAAPNLISYDIMGVQPMTGPSGMVFALRSRYANQQGDEAFYREANTQYGTVASGANTFGNKNVGTDPVANVGQYGGNNMVSGSLYNFAGAMATAQAEMLGVTGNTPYPQMAFSIEKVTVSAKSRALAAMYTPELAQDLRAIHGLDADTELTNILSMELLAEINREAVRTIYLTAVPGSQIDTATPGIFDLDTDSNGRWSAEKFKGLHFQIERECNKIAKDTRRGKGNILICSSDVASALSMTGVLSYTPDLAAKLNVDDTGNTFAGILGGRIKVYIDPYATTNFMVVGYKGVSRFDAGVFYCPYVPLQLQRAVYPGTFQPTIGFKTRYGMVANPFSSGALDPQSANYPHGSDGVIRTDDNVYYRRTRISSLM
jgi:hypothetical protein